MKRANVTYYNEYIHIRMDIAGENVEIRLGISIFNLLPSVYG